jgi:hypothetical protein
LSIGFAKNRQKCLYHAGGKSETGILACSVG